MRLITREYGMGQAYKIIIVWHIADPCMHIMYYTCKSDITTKSLGPISYCLQ